MYVALKSIFTTAALRVASDSER